MPVMVISPPPGSPPPLTLRQPSHEARPAWSCMWPAVSAGLWAVGWAAQDPPKWGCSSSKHVLFGVSAGRYSSCWAQGPHCK
eukprot:5428394-Alexandrium_andersonii.AAC.1